MKSELHWNDKMHFTLTASTGHVIDVDASPEFGGEDRGTRPKELILEGLLGCTGMDIIAVLEKMRVKPAAFRMEGEAELSENHPKVFTKVHLRYIVSGDVPAEKLAKAINLSQETYCGVSAMLRNGGTEITWEQIIED